MWSKFRMGVMRRVWGGKELLLRVKAGKDCPTL